MNSNSFMRVQVRVQKKYFFGYKFESGKTIEFFRVQVRVRSPGEENKQTSVLNVPLDKALNEISQSYHAGHYSLEAL